MQECVFPHYDLCVGAHVAKLVFILRTVVCLTNTVGQLSMKEVLTSAMLSIVGERERTHLGSIRMRG